MLISHSHKFIFFHVYKVAGTSIREKLRKYAYLKTKKNIIKSTVGINPKIYCSDFNGHIKAKDLQNLIPKKIFDNYFKFGFVRNPWDWQVSLFHFALQSPNHHQHKLIAGMKDFDEYIEWRVNYDLKLQKDFLYDGDTKLVNFVGRMENLDEDFSNICKILNIPSQVLSKSNLSKHKNYKELYSEKGKKLIEEAFVQDIKTFNYQF